MKKRAIVSVSDKTGIVDFCKNLVECGYEIISTGGTKKFLMKQVLIQYQLMRLLVFLRCLMVELKHFIR